jgi:sulfate permease, SulP family
VRVRILDAAADGGIHAVVLDAETTPFIDVSASRMLTALDQDLRARGVRLLIARDVGQFRDVLSHATDIELGRRYATIDAAVTAATKPRGGEAR